MKNSQKKKKMMITETSVRWFKYIRIMLYIIMCDDVCKIKEKKSTNYVIQNLYHEKKIRFLDH